MGVLSQILAAKQAEIHQLRERAKDSLCSPQFRPRPVSLFREPGSPLRLIAELKFRSPSAGPLSRTLDVEGRALAYQSGGASMMSVLCDGPFFDGEYSHLARVRSTCDIPLLCKEFVLDEIQLQYAAASGADWVLLIVRCLTPLALQQLIRRATDLGLGALVEVHSTEDLNVALEAGASVIGVNARDLDTLEMRAGQAASVLASVPPHITSLHLSGLKTPSDVASLASSRVHAALIGEVLMRLDDPVPLLTSLAAAARVK
jgi:indole-3-glycerol phosphate synthase